MRLLLELLRLLLELLRFTVEEPRLLVEPEDLWGETDCERPFELLVLLEPDALAVLDDDEREPL